MKALKQIEQSRTERGDEAARTLRELGVPGPLAADLEAAFQALGRTEGNRVKGYTFVTPEGTRHALRLEKAVADAAPERAA